MTLTPVMITTNSLDPEPLATWWAEQTGASITQDYGGEFLIVSGGTLPFRLAFQRVPDPAPGHNRVHVDLTAPDLDAEVERLVAAGASVVEQRGGESFRWVTLADPQGNEFCVAQSEGS
jgi:Glyoxalase-like domain